MECRWERPRALKRILLQRRFADFHSKARPGGKRILPFTIRMAAKPSRSSQTTIPLARLDQAADLLRQEIRNAASTCRLAIPPIGPSHACGAMRMPEASAAADTFHSAVMPPTCAMSG